MNHFRFEIQASDEINKSGTPANKVAVFKAENLKAAVAATLRTAIDMIGNHYRISNIAVGIYVVGSIQANGIISHTDYNPEYRWSIYSADHNGTYRPLPDELKVWEVTEPPFDVEIHT
jgi:hypothetical protein